MIVRFAELKDIVNINEFYKDYQGESIKRFGAVFSRLQTASTIQRLTEQGSVIIGEFEGKIIAGIAGLFSPCGMTQDIMFCSLLFYVQPDKRNHTKQFIKEVEILLKDKATMFVIGIPADDGNKMERFFSMIGFDRLETNLYKRIK